MTIKMMTKYNSEMKQINSRVMHGYLILLSQNFTASHMVTPSHALMRDTYEGLASISNVLCKQNY